MTSFPPPPESESVPVVPVIVVLPDVAGFVLEFSAIGPTPSHYTQQDATPLTQIRAALHPAFCTERSFRPSKTEVNWQMYSAQKHSMADNMAPAGPCLKARYGQDKTVQRRSQPQAEIPGRRAALPRHPQASSVKRPSRRRIRRPSKRISVASVPAHTIEPDIRNIRSDVAFIAGRMTTGST